MLCRSERVTPRAQRLGAPLRLGPTGLAFGQPPSAASGWVGDWETRMVVAMGVEQSPKDAAVERAQ
jgi:hypothetical protein